MFCPRNRFVNGCRRSPIRYGSCATPASLSYSGILDHDLAGLFLEVGEAIRDRGTGVLFTIDELQFLARDHLAALMVGLHRISQEQLPVLVAGAGLPSLPGLAGDAKTYAERLFAFRVINNLDYVEARAALADPAQAGSVHWQPDALDRIDEELARRADWTFREIRDYENSDINSEFSSRLFCPGRDAYPVDARISVLPIRDVPDLRRRLDAM